MLFGGGGCGSITSDKIDEGGWTSGGGDVVIVGGGGKQNRDGDGVYLFGR